ncbi:MAG: mucoidy inhibitor MuiA family protein [Myxococcota bacterium]
MVSPRIWLTLLGLLGVACAPPPTPPVTPDRAAPSDAPETTPKVFELARAVGDAEEAPKDAVSSRITAVTVYSDRALVTREAAVQLKKGSKAYHFAQLPGWVDEGSVRAGTTEGKILDVSVARQFLASSSDEGFREVEKAHRALLRRQQALNDELAILDAQKEHVGSIKVYSLEKLSTDAVTRDVDVGQYGEVVDFVSGKLRATAQARRDLEAKLEDLQPEVAASARRVEELKRLTTLEQTTVTVTVEAASARPGTLRLTYATPGATWEPVHEMRARRDQPEKVALTSFAVVTQTTGEDWTGAALKFSTQSSLNAEQIPELERLALGETRTVTRSTKTTTSTFSRAQRAYEEQNRFWNQLNQNASKKTSDIKRFEQVYESNLESLERVQDKTVEIFQGLQRRGTTAHFEAIEPGVVRSDGRPVRLPIGGKTIASRDKIVAAPEQSLNAALTLRMTNGVGQALLPGRVSRFYDGAFLGMTDLDFVAPGENFDVFFRVADQVKLTRELDRKMSSISRATRHRMKLSFVTTVENLGTRPVTMTLAERVPVSESSDIRVSRVVITPRVSPDVEGIARFDLSLAPGEKREVRVSYQVDYPPSLILDVKRRRKSEPLPAAPSRQRRLEEDLLDFEQKF